MCENVCGRRDSILFPGTTGIVSAESRREVCVYRPAQDTYGYSHSNQKSGAPPSVCSGDARHRSALIQLWAFGRKSNRHKRGLEISLTRCKQRRNIFLIATNLGPCKFALLAFRGLAARRFPRIIHDHHLAFGSPLFSDAHLFGDLRTRAVIPNRNTPLESQCAKVLSLASCNLAA